MATATRVIETPNTSKTTSKPEYKITEIKDATGREVIKLMSTHRVANNLFLDPLYISREMKKVLWADPIVIYSTPGKEFGPIVEFDSVIFQVPKEFQNLKNTVLALTSMSFKAREIDGKLVLSIRNGKNIMLVENFPNSNGWYFTEQRTGIPQGAEISSDNLNARYLYRRKDQEYIGPVVRGYYIFCYDRRYVCADGRLSYGYGVALVEPIKLEREAKQAQLVGKVNVSRKVDALLRTVNPAEQSLQKLTGVIEESQLRAVRNMIRRAKALEIKA